MAVHIIFGKEVESMNVAALDEVKDEKFNLHLVISKSGHPYVFHSMPFSQDLG